MKGEQNNLQTNLENAPLTLLIHPQYVFAQNHSMTQARPYLPMSMIYAGALMEAHGQVKIDYHDCAVRPLDSVRLVDYDAFGITVMGTSNITSAGRVYNDLLKNGVMPHQVTFGGQGVEGLTEDEFQTLFPGAQLHKRTQLMDVGLGEETDANYWSADISPQLKKFSPEDMANYLSGEITLPFSQGCKFSCDFCGAQTAKKEMFFDVAKYYLAIANVANQLSIKNLTAYATSLDFFQQALKGGDVSKLEQIIDDLIEAQNETGVSLRFRSLARPDSYMEATKHNSLMDKLREAGFYQCGFGADGAASVEVLRAMHKGNNDLRSTLFDAFSDMEKRGFTPEILYVFGVGADTTESLNGTYELCTELMTSFPTSIYRGFPAKDFIPGNKNWNLPVWKSSPQRKALLSDPELFVNLDFTSLANCITHPDEIKRKLVNHNAVRMSAKAHELGRVQSYLTIPRMKVDGRELMMEETFEEFKRIIGLYAPEIAANLTLKNLPQYREAINEKIPRDK